MDWLRLYKKLREFAEEQGFVSDEADTHLMEAAKAIAEDPRSNTDDLSDLIYSAFDAEHAVVINTAHDNQEVPAAALPAVLESLGHLDLSADCRENDLGTLLRKEQEEEDA